MRRAFFPTVPALEQGQADIKEGVARIEEKQGPVGPAVLRYHAATSSQEVEARRRRVVTVLG